MAQKEKRSKCSRVGAGRNQNAAKQAAARRSRKTSSPEPLSRIRNNVITVALGSFIFLTVLLMLVARTYSVHGNSQSDDNGHRIPHIDGAVHGKSQSDDNGHRIPHIDGVAMEFDPERGNKTQNFLNNFVCDYQPATEVMAEIGISEKGYCHPRLSAVPNHRTQRISSENESAENHGIPKGELVMRLPRPLQVWDLDALRDKFIQQEFLGFAVDEHSIEVDGMKPSISKVTVRHKQTQNPLDSGVFLAVYLIRLLHGSRARKTSSDSGNDGQCQNDSEECKLIPLIQHWGSFEQHKQRISTLSAYLDVLPTINDRLGSKIIPQSHPLFWSSSLLQATFPPNTSTYDLIRHYQQMIESEYRALILMSDEFGKNVKYLQYLNMRVNVVSRAFGLSASTNDNGVHWGISDDTKEMSLVEEMRSYETSNFGSFLNEDDVVEDFKLRSMCPLLDMYQSHPNPNVSWRYDSTTSSYIMHATKKSSIPPGHSIVVSYGKYTDGHLFAKYGYVNGDGSSRTEISLAVFHRMIGDVGLGRQYSQLPFHVWDPNSRDEIFGSLLHEKDNVFPDMQKSLSSAKEALGMQAKELVRYLMFDDGYEECIDATANSNSSDERLKLLKLQHLIRVANYRDAWIIRIPPQFPDARPLQTLSFNGNGESTQSNTKEGKRAMGINANHVISICRLISLRADDIGGDAVGHLREGLTSYGSWKLSTKSFFLVERHGDALEYRAMMCVVRLCNVGLSRYVGYDNSEPEVVGSRMWNAWYVTTGEVRALGTLLQTASSEANRLKRKYQSSQESMVASSAALLMRNEGACPLNYSLPLLNRL